MGINFEALTAKKNDLVRKTVDCSFFIAPHTAGGLTSLTDTDKGLLALPAGWEDVGLLSKDAIKHQRKVDVSDIKSAGRTDPTRSDITSDQTTIQIGCQETKLITIGLGTGADPSSITPDPTTGEVSIAKPTRPKPRYYRGLSLGVDEIDAGEIYIARYFPRVRVTDYDDQPYAPDDDEASPLYGVTLTAYTDSVAGYSERWLFGGPGWHSLLAEMGF